MVENFHRLGSNPEVGVRFGEEDGVVAINDEDCGKGKAPTGIGGGLITQAGVVMGDVDQDGLIVAAEHRRDGVGNAEAVCYDSAWV